MNKYSSKYDCENLKLLTMKKNVFLLLISLLIITACSDNNQYYNVQDFNTVKKIDAHIHLWTFENSFIEQAEKDNFKGITVMVDHNSNSLIPQSEFSIYHATNNADKVSFVTTFEMAGWDEPDWQEKTIKWIDEQISSGAVGVKVWKNIGMEFRDKNGNLVMIDDPKLDTIFRYLSDKKIPVMGHLGEPKNCWLPLEEMTTNNDRHYFSNNPQYHMYLHPEFPSYEDQIAARDHMLEKNPDLIFVGAHLGSLEWSLDELVKRLDKFPNMAVDLAARMGQLYCQTIEDREKVRNFFIKYQDRLLYGTDLIDRGEKDAAGFKERLHQIWFHDWKYFVSEEKMFSNLVDSEFQGIRLPKAVIDKLYFENARKWFGVFN